ncbi:VanW family protein [Pedobacter sp. Leaf41]|uniref:VanW family protein n=1 Tax=Pedobacter sp. Leaf41 TaxID=1736218 RepID=UPI000AD3161D|nr:VanW family protein [Pedobacter sp. Leaf41]
MKAFKILLISYAAFLFLLLGLFCWLIAPEYFACEKTMFEGEQGLTIFGDKVDCSGENQAFGEAIFQASLLVLVIGFLFLIVGWYFYSKGKKKMLISKSSPTKQRKLLSQRHPYLYFLATWTRRLKRRLEWTFDDKKYAKTKTEDKLQFRIKKHQSVLLKKLGENNEQLQLNKITNLKIAAAQINGIVIKPGETFSFCKLVGLPTKRKGYLPGMELSFGEAKAGIGGGICQISNLIHWLVIHSPLTVTERRHHSFDPFPDDGRVLPFGSGATVFYNYLDYQFINNTEQIFQINLWFSDKCLEGELRINSELNYAYHVMEKEHRFLKIDGQFYRKNEIWRDKLMKFEGGKIVETELIMKNFARVTYEPESYEEHENDEKIPH